LKKGKLNKENKSLAVMFILLQKQTHSKYLLVPNQCILVVEKYCLKIGV